MTPEELLDLPLPGRSLGAGTVRGYLVSLLASLWRDGGVFPARQIFGPDGWRSELHGPMVVAGAMPGTVDENGRPDIGYKAEREADALILAAIELLGQPARQVSTPPAATVLGTGKAEVCSSPGTVTLNTSVAGQNANLSALMRFSPQEARGLAALIIQKADEAEAAQQQRPL